VKKIKTVFTIILLLIFSGCSETQKKDESSSENIDISNKQIAEAKALLTEKKYELLTVAGENITVKKVGSEYQFAGKEDKLIILDFFSTWCPACRAVAPHLGSIQKKYPEKVLVLGVLLEENKPDSEIISFQKRYRASYPISNATRENYKLSATIASTLRLPRSFPIPLLVMLKEGKYFTHYIGAVAEEMIESDIKRALELRKGN